MDYKFWIAQILGFIAMIFLALSFRKNRKNNILKYQNYSNAIMAIQYIFIEGYEGLAMYIMCLVRNFTYSRYKNGETPKVFFILILTLMIFLSMLTFKNIYSLLPLLGIGLNSYGLWQKKLKVTRRCELTSAVLVTIYNLIVRSYTGALTTGIEGVLTIIAIINYDILKRRKI